MSKKLKIRLLGQPAARQHPLPHKFLPNPLACFRLLIFSPSNSGKSNLLKNIITRDDFGYSKYYGKNIFLFSKTLHLDSVWTDLKLPKSHQLSEWNDSTVSNIMQFAQKQPAGILLVLDDMITCGDAVNNKRNSILKTLFFQGRHMGISLVIISQQLKAIPSCMRINATHLICFNLRNQSEEQDFVKENDYVDDLLAKYPRCC
jgi:hypothetical protein